MAVRSEIRIPKKHASEEPADEPKGQGKPVEKGPFRLQVDRQTKDSYATYEEAEAVGLALKKRFPIVQVTIYDTVKGERKIIELAK